jgi:redox-sensitive bicupin YhaK (pirin superfamily)
MITLRPADERGITQTDWLDSRHSFSFADYYNPNHMHFRTLRVINQDIVQPGKGFGLHPHQDMEILTYILRGALEHRDSLGNQGIIKAGEMQRMTAGTGILHSEMNTSANEEVELLQIWILPAQKQLAPSYQQQAFTDRQEQLQLVVSPTGEQQSLVIHQDVRVYRGLLAAKQTAQYNIADERFLWLQLITGKLMAENHQLKPGDGLAFQQLAKINLTALQDAEFLLFDLA